MHARERTFVQSKLLSWAMEMNGFYFVCVVVVVVVFFLILVFSVLVCNNIFTDSTEPVLLRYMFYNLNNRNAACAADAAAYCRRCYIQLNYA